MYNYFMTNSSSGDNSIELYLREKRDELIWALSLQHYSDAQIGRIFNIKYRSTTQRIIARKPKDWKPKWVKE